MRDAAERLRDILEAIDRIEKYAARGRASFEADELIQTWMVHHIEVIGEASRALSPEFQSRFPDIPWRAMIGMRNIIAHQYFGIDLGAVWSVIDHDLPTLKQNIARALEELSANDNV